MAVTDLPEDVMVNILSWLPVKSLIRFTSVSKRWRHIVRHRNSTQLVSGKPSVADSYSPMPLNSNP
ncbi:PREDICTED: putative F-box protein At1g19160-like [Fragaria vesca subsp. vesca]